MLVQDYRCRVCGWRTEHFFQEPRGHGQFHPDLKPIVFGVSPDVPDEQGKKRILFFETAPLNSQELVSLIELFFEREAAFKPIAFKLFGAHIEEEVLFDVLTTPAPLATASALLAHYSQDFSLQERPL